MATVQIKKPIDSATLTLPVLQPIVGNAVEFVRRERNGVVVTAGSGDWKALEVAASQLDGYDFEAWRQQRSHDQRDETEMLP